MKTPFSYTGSKALIASEIWSRFGEPKHYFEPFAGVLGALLGRPGKPQCEYVGDVDCLITNFWRAAKWADPAEIAKWADWPHNSLDLKARLSFFESVPLEKNLLSNPRWYDLQIAAWYAWVNSVRMHNRGGCLQMMRAKGVRRKNQDLTVYFRQLQNRLKEVTVYYGDWTHLSNAAVTCSGEAPTALLLDPPYEGVAAGMYRHHDRSLSARCREFALAAASPSLLIAVCGYEGQAGFPRGWKELAWRSKAGRGRERIWFSPGCRRVAKVG